MSPKARHAKGKARINSYEALFEKKLTSAARIWRFIFRREPRLGNVVIEADGVNKGYGDNLLVEDMTFSYRRAGSLV